MNNNQPSTTYRRVLWLSVGLALFTALAYVLINVGVLAVGDVPHDEGSTTIAYIAAGCYLLGGLLILLRRRGLWIFGVGMNTLVLFFFFRMYQDRPVVVFSPGGLATKIPQLLLEVSLIALIIMDWRRSHLATPASIGTRAAGKIGPAGSN